MAQGSYDLLLSQVDKTLAQFSKVVDSSQKALFEEIHLLVSGLDKDSSGNIKTTISNMQQVVKIKAKIGNIVISDAYRNAVSMLINGFDLVYRTQKAYYKKSFEAGTIGETAAKKQELLHKMSVQNTIEGLTGAGIQAQITDKIGDMLMRSVTSGARWTDMVAEMKAYLDPDGDGTGAFAKYAKTYATTAMGQFTGQNNKLMTDALDTEWYMYVGSDIETTREFCLHLTKKRYIHVSEIPTILEGHIDGHDCAIYKKTGLPQGMIEGTTPENFQVNVGGWNCRHQLLPVAAEAVPADIRARFEKKKEEQTFNSDFEKWYSQNRSWYETHSQFMNEFANNMIPDPSSKDWQNRSMDRLNRDHEYVIKYYAKLNAEIEDWESRLIALGKLVSSSNSSSAKMLFDALKDLVTKARTDSWSVTRLESKAYGFDKKEREIKKIINEEKKAAKTAEKIAKEREAQSVSSSDISEAFKSILGDLQSSGITYRPVEKLASKKTDDEIIERLAGGDKTSGSCSSLAMAYAGNKCGLDVLDFRGGKSQENFSDSRKIMEIARALGGSVEKHTSDYTKAIRLLNTMKKGHQYYFTCGKHAAIVRIGENGKAEYLELQSWNDNGFKPLTRNVLYMRFGAQESHSALGRKIETEDCIIDVELFENAAVREMLGYINTSEGSQKKGKEGTIK